MASSTTRSGPTRRHDSDTRAAKDVVGAPPTVDEVMAVLSNVIDPELGADIVSLGMVPSVEVGDDGVGHGRDQAHDQRLPDARRDQEGSRDPRRAASRCGRHEDRVGRDERRRAQRGHDQGPLERTRERGGHDGARLVQRAGDRVRQGRRRQVVGHGEPRRSAGANSATRSACSTPTSGASRSLACWASATGWRPRRSTDPTSR